MAMRWSGDGLVLLSILEIKLEKRQECHKVSWCKTYCLPSGGKIGVHNAMWKRVGEETKLAFKCKLKDERREQREVVERLVDNEVEHELNAWKVNLMDTNFNHSDAQRIKTFVFLRTFENDKLIWRFSLTSNYIVCSSYHNLMERVLNNDHLMVHGDWMLI
ncbi:hypothetical protein JHK82_055839 [Glycine max]|nr:hypothetical protein JHK84_055705 [Glycine max]KAG5077144.1 hypothetical protein JHK82_055839 [Glycine max]